MRLILSDHNVRAILVNIFGGITRGDEVARGLDRGPRPAGARRAAWSCASWAPTPRKPRPSSGGGLRDRQQPRRCGGQGGRQRRGIGVVSILVDRSTRLLVQGITGREGDFHARQMQAYGTNVVVGRDARQGRSDGRSTAASRSSTPWPQAVAADGRRHERASTSPPRARPTPSSKRRDAGHRHDLLHHRGHPGPRHAHGRARRSKRREPGSSGPNCPGATSPGRAKVGIIPGSIHREGRVGRGLALGHLDLRGRAGHDRRRHRAVDLRRHRRRPDHRLTVPRRAGALPRRPRDRGASCSSARSAAPPRRRRRGLRRGASSGPADGRLHRRPHRRRKASAWAMPGRSSRAAWARAAGKVARARGGAASVWPTHRPRSGAAARCGAHVTLGTPLRAGGSVDIASIRWTSWIGVTCARRSSWHAWHAPMATIPSAPPSWRLTAAMLAEAGNSVAADGPTAHAELNAVRAISHSTRRRSPGRRSTTSTEPCAMCAGAILLERDRACRLRARRGRACVRMTGDDPANPTMALPCREVFARGQRQTIVEGPALEDEARAVHAGFWR